MSRPSTSRRVFFIQLNEILEENESLKTQLVEANSTINSLRKENTALLKRLEQFAKRITIIERDNTFITNFNNNSKQCENWQFLISLEEIPENNYEIHYSRCIRLKKKCEACSKVLTEQQYQEHIESQQDPIKIIDCIKESNFEQLVSFEAHGTNLAQIKAENKDDSLLHIAVKFSSLEMARYLISKISDLNMQNSYGETPLHYAVKSKNADMVRLFVSLGADWSIPNKLGDTAISQAQRTGSHEIVLIFMQRARPNIHNEHLTQITSQTNNQNMSGGPTPEEVLCFQEACSDFLCPLEANIYDIKFGNFRVRDIESGATLFDFQREPESQTEETRFIQYSFPPEFLRLTTIGTMLTFTVGDQPINGLRMIERHYFRNRLIQSYDFMIGFCIPNTSNTWEHIYNLPQFQPEEITEIVNSPFEIKSDSFFFVDDQLIMHTRAEYDYSGN